MHPYWRRLLRPLCLKPDNGAIDGSLGRLNDHGDVPETSVTAANQVFNNVVDGERGGGTSRQGAQDQLKQSRPLLSQQWDETRQRFLWKQEQGVLMMALMIYDALLSGQ